MVGVGKVASGTFVKTLVNRSRKKNSGKRNTIVALMLTPMVDMFSLLVIFLLQAFSASPELLYVAKGVTLPNAVTGGEMKDAPVMAVTADEIHLDQKSIGKTQDILRSPRPLMIKLGEQRDLWMKTHPGQEFPGKITLQAHREVPSVVIAQLMGMLPSQNFGTVQLAVVAGSSIPKETHK